MLRLVFILLAAIISTEFDLNGQTQVEIKNQIDSLVNASMKLSSAESIALIDKAHTLAAEIQFWEKDVECLFRLSLSHLQIGKVKFSDVYLDSALVVGQKYLDGSSPMLSFVYIQKAKNLRKRRDYIRSKELALEALHKFENMSFLREGSFNNIIAENLIALGDYTSAVSYLNFSTDEWDETLDWEDELFVYYEGHYLKARVAAQISKDSLVFFHLSKAAEIIIESKFANAEFELLNLWTFGADYFIKQDDVDMCKYYLDKINSSGYTMQTVQEAEYYSILANYRTKLVFPIDSVVSLCSLAISLFNEGNLEQNNDVNKHENLKLLGDLYLNEIDYSSALFYYESALDTLRVDWETQAPSSILHKPSVIKVMSALFETHYLNNDEERGRAVLDKLLSIMRYFIIEKNSDSHIEFWAEENISILEKGLEFALQFGDEDLAFRLIEENKSNLLVKDMITHQLRSSLGKENSFAKQEKELIYEISRLRRLVISVSSSEEKEVLNREISQKELSLEQILGNLEAKDQNYVNIKYNLDRLDLETYQKTLADNECAVEFFIGLDNVYQISITSENVLFLKREKQEVLKRDIQLLFEQNSFNADVTVVDSISCLIFYRLELDKLKEFAPHCKRIKVIPDDYLSNVSFGQLVDNAGRALIEDYSIEYQYSSYLDRLLDDRQNDVLAKKFLGYAYESKDGSAAADIRSCSANALTNLLCSKQELSEIQSIVADGNSYSVDSKIDFIDNCSLAKVIHLATHACVDVDDPENSRLYFGEDFLTSYELKLLKLNSDLVVLSACETGYGDIVSGEGSMSISKAFFQAGTKSTLVSLWPVDDCSTSQLMELFYTELKSGLPKDKALRQAQLKYRRTANPEFTAPYYWAGFVVVGDTSPVWSSYSFDENWILAIILVFGLLGLTFLLKTKNSIPWSI